MKRWAISHIPEPTKENDVKQTILSAGLLALTLSLSACGSDETTIVHDRPIIVNPASTSTPSDVESNCRHGYDNSSHSCY
jgi:hypothetical protein